MISSLFRNLINGIRPAEPDPDDEESLELEEDTDAIDLEQFGRRMFRGYMVSSHIRLLIATLTRWAETPDSRGIVTMPPRHSKSVHVSENLPAWYLGRHPDRRVIGASHTQNLANTFSRRVRRKFIDPRWPYRDVKLDRERRAVEQWDISPFGGGYYAVGRGGSPAGVGGDLIIIDDPIKNAKDANSESVREDLWEWYRETMRTRLEPGGTIIVTATRWHEDDLTGRLLEAMEQGGEQFEHLHLPAINSRGEALWPEYWPISRLEPLKGAVGTWAWNAQYQGDPVSDEDGTFKRWWWRFWHKPGIILPPVPVKGPGGSIVFCPVSQLPAKFDQELQSWDMAFKGDVSKRDPSKDEGSYVVGQAWGATAADRFLLHQFRENVEFPQTLTAVRAMTAVYPNGAKLVEAKANGPAVVQTLRSTIGGLIEVEPGDSKEGRANAVSPQVESGNVYLPHPSLAPWVWQFIEEAAGFPMKKLNDQVDAMSQALIRFGTGVKQGGVYDYMNKDRNDDDRDVDERDRGGVYDASYYDRP